MTDEPFKPDDATFIPLEQCGNVTVKRPGAAIQQENSKPAPGKPFVKGDKRINRKGRPKSFDALRKLAVKIAGETIPSPDGEDITRIEALLRVLTSSKNPADRALFLAYAFGKPKEQLDVTTAGEKITEVVIRYADTDNPAETAPGTDTGKADPPEV